ncbi:MAG: phosphatidate cytidylyltransferase [Xanthomonadales bacterium]|nr:phosphatidate cytidylyltransferase [Xanthomonadales bacterium]NIN59301.1 phosphatidate cytidylyltransferase [Xanthomonadales bacterium]NIN74663.1 phosphatidate cytidylyltransferase [Xanthomonadales bacterium]NIO13329.1 phosphatidate cytidylyltransferase [Xanthomonadales bacterium]NIP11694.1 phosphatidate cytidylyltransferase [Xanthomonadales bacterium]
MLRTRVITAAALLPLAFLLVFGASQAVFSLVLSALLLVGSWEFHRLAGVAWLPAGLGLLLFQATLFALLYAGLDAWLAHASDLLTIACALWLLMLLRLRGYRPGAVVDKRYRTLSLACAPVVITAGWLALTTLHELAGGGWWILVLLLIIWAADIGAYFAGRAFGKAKLAPHISPGKTRAGLVAGMLLAVVTAVLAGQALAPQPLSPPVWAGIGLVTALVSAGGDLFISLHKRTVGRKDSGMLFPGHGGVLDRLDSLLAGAPFFTLGILLAH